MTVCFIISAFLVAIVLLHGLLELHYFLRTFLSFLLARFCKKKVHILQETVVKGICLTSDIDTFLYHMNNARFMRELDFARADFYERTGLFKVIKTKGGSIAICATTIRYRRFLKLFNRYFITSKIIYWDDQNIYMEHRFITPKENFVNAIAFAKTRVIKANAEEVMNELLTSPSFDVEASKKTKPELPPEVAKWIESNEISSKSLRNFAQ